MIRVEVNPALFIWARERARLGGPELTKAFPKLPLWERGEGRPTLKQLERFARRTHAPIGYFFLAEPPEEPLPIPDFRTIRNEPIARPSADLLDTVYISLERQDWYSQHLRLLGEEPLEFVGSLTLGGSVEAAATAMREALDFGLERRRSARTYDEGFRLFRQHAEDLRILVMTSGIVFNATRRNLDPNEFRGFTLVDRYAPLIFVNSADSMGAQAFTLAHELVHVWTGRTGLTDTHLATTRVQDDERWCNQVAAELLVPIAEFRDAWRGREDVIGEAQRTARQFKVSSLVTLRRALDAGFIDEEVFWAVFHRERDRLTEFARSTEGGSFYNSEFSRVNRRFAAAVVSSTLEGITTYRDAFRLLAVKNASTVQEMGHRLGVLV